MSVSGKETIEIRCRITFIKVLLSFDSSHNVTFKTMFLFTPATKLHFQIIHSKSQYSAQDNLLIHCSFKYWRDIFIRFSFSLDLSIMEEYCDSDNGEMK
jgi:hypothetical protein